MVRVIAHLPDPGSQKRLAAALALREQAWRPALALASGWPAAREAALEAAPELLVFDPYAGGLFDCGPVARFAADFPSCVLFAYGRFPGGSARDVLALGRDGVHGVATRDLDDDAPALARLLDEALEHGTLRRALSLFERAFPPPVHDVLSRILLHADAGLTPAEAARLCHCHSKTLRLRLRRAGLPSLGRLIVWMRLIRACRFLLDTARSVENVALVLDFPSANDFRNQLHRYAAVTPTELRDRGDPEYVLNCFLVRYHPLK